MHHYTYFVMFSLSSTNSLILCRRLHCAVGLSHLSLHRSTESFRRWIIDFDLILNWCNMLRNWRVWFSSAYHTARMRFNFFLVIPTNSTNTHTKPDLWIKMRLFRGNNLEGMRCSTVYSDRNSFAHFFLYVKNLQLDNSFNVFLLSPHSIIGFVYIWAKWVFQEQSVHTCLNYCLSKRAHFLFSESWAPWHEFDCIWILLWKGKTVQTERRYQNVFVMRNSLTSIGVGEKFIFKSLPNRMVLVQSKRVLTNSFSLNIQRMKKINLALKLFTTDHSTIE